MSWTAEEVAAKRKLHITVTNDDGETVYKTWNADEGRKTVTLYLDETEAPLTDARKGVMGEVIGRSIWGLDPVALRRERDARILRVQPGDVVVFETEQPISAAEATRIKQELVGFLTEAGHGNVSAMVVSQGKLLTARVEPTTAPSADSEVRG
jgi:hypothetical protein